LEASKVGTLGPEKLLTFLQSSPIFQLPLNAGKSGQKNDREIGPVQPLCGPAEEDEND
jgi:hypothetical protein